MWNYRLVKHDLPNQDGNVYLHEVHYEDDGNIGGITQKPEKLCAVTSDPDWYPEKMKDIVEKGGAALMEWEMDFFKKDIDRNSEIINYSDHVPPRITNIHEDTLENALHYAREVLIGIYQNNDKEDIIWLNVSGIEDLTFGFHEEIFSMSGTRRDELHPDIDFQLGDYEGRPDVLRIKVAFSYLKGE